MPDIEEHAFKTMVDIFTKITVNEKINFDGYFATDMYKVNGKSDIYPCFVGFNQSKLVLVKLDSELRIENIQMIPTTSTKSIKTKKMFLSKDFYLHIELNDHSSFVLGVPRKNKYIPCQKESTETFLSHFKLS